MGLSRKIQLLQRHSEAGFTLLELLLVVAILSSLALAATTFVDNMDDQTRFEETNRRLDLIHFAIVGENRPVYGGQALLSGYVADNGRLPGSLQNLLEKPGADTTSDTTDDFDSFDLHSPIFDADPDNTSGLNNGGSETTLSAGSEQLPKGHRGTYLTADSQKRFVDGWGNTAAAPNYGWSVSPITITSITVTSPGKNNLLNVSDTNYDKDLSRLLVLNPDIAGWQVTVRNASGTDLLNDATNFRVSLLVYGNDTGATGRWKRFSTDRVATCLDGTGDGQVDPDGPSPGGPLPPVPCPSTATLTFPSGGYPGGSLSTAIPQGRHILVLVQDSDTTAHNGSSETAYRETVDVSGKKICFKDSVTNCITQQVTFFAGMSPPSGELVIRPPP
jgi:prepilin-type N-terminal cleavage/methylation domain-containing protein